MTVTAAGSKSIQLQTVGGNVPYASNKQRKFFNVNKKKLEKQGVDVDEWNQSSKGMKLPEKVRAGKRIFGKK